MRILFYSSSSNFYNDAASVSFSLPSCQEELEKLAVSFPEHTFIIATQKPGMFLLDNAALPSSVKALNLEYHLISFDDEKETADFLLELKPDIAVAASFYLQPFDWLTVKDSLIASALRKNGVKVFCHSVQTALTCFNKEDTHSLLEKLKINTPEAVFIDHTLFINAGNRPAIKSNIYKKGILHLLKNFKYPLVIKDTTGLSSLGTDVLNTYGEVHDTLHSKKFTADKIAEEYIQGLHFGTEILALPHGKGFKYKIQQPLLFSTNKYGITSPKQSLKTGPVNPRRYKLRSLNRMLKNLSRACGFEGVTQVDLIFDGKKWYVIEINPRLSGMSETYAAMNDRSIYETLAECAGIKKSGFKTKESLTKKKTGGYRTEGLLRGRKRNFVLNIKFPLLEEEELKKIAELTFIKKVHQIRNLEAKQLRERGYCEVILTGKNKKELLENLESLKQFFPDKMETVFYEKAKEAVSKI